MTKISFLLLLLFTLWSCSNDDINHGSNGSIPEQATIFVRLLDNGTENAGTVRIVSDAPDAELTWITLPDCNLDTTQTMITLKNGVAELPVKWMNKGEDGKYAPQNLAFKAWLGIKTADKLDYIPLILSERVDSVALAQSVQTRTANITPRAASFYFSPLLVNLQKTTGGTATLKATEVGTVELDYTHITAAMNIDKSILPASVVTESVLNFKWLNNQAPADAFSVLVTAHSISTGLWADLTLNYDPDGGGGEEDIDTELKFVISDLPEGNLLAASKIFTFTFEGTYRGPVQIRTFADGVLLYTAGAYTFNGSQPRGRVLENAGAARAITFQYKRDGRDWTNLPASTNRIQDGNGGVVPPVPGDKPSHTGVTPAGDIPDAGGKYSATFYNYAGDVFFRAVSGKGRLLAHESFKVAAGGIAQPSLIIPESTSRADNMVIFQFSTDDANWTDIETRTQIVETFASGSFNDMPMTIPVTGGTYHYSSTGTLSAVLTIVAKDDDGNVLVESKGKAGTPIPVVIPANKAGRARSIFFWYIRGDQPGRYNYIKKADQAGI